MVGVLQPALAAKDDELTEIFVRIVGIDQNVRDQCQIERRAVADQHVAVAVEDFAACRRDAGVVGEGVCGGAALVRCLRDLHMVKLHKEHGGHDRDEDQQKTHTEGKFMLIHNALRFLQYA